MPESLALQSSSSSIGRSSPTTPWPLGPFIVPTAPVHPFAFQDISAKAQSPDKKSEFQTISLARESSDQQQQQQQSNEKDRMFLTGSQEPSYIEQLCRKKIHCFIFYATGILILVQLLATTFTYLDLTSLVRFFDFARSQQMQIQNNTLFNITNYLVRALNNVSEGYPHRH